MYGTRLRGWAIATFVVLTGAFALAFFYAPEDADQGFIQKIFYVHVPLAITALCGFVLGGLLAIGHLSDPTQNLSALTLDAFDSRNGPFNMGESGAALGLDGALHVGNVAVAVSGTAIVGFEFWRFASWYFFGGRGVDIGNRRHFNPLGLNNFQRQRSQIEQQQ